MAQLKRIIMSRGFLNDTIWLHHINVGVSIIGNNKHEKNNSVRRRWSNGRPPTNRKSILGILSTLRLYTLTVTDISDSLKL